MDIRLSAAFIAEECMKEYAFHNCSHISRYQFRGVRLFRIQDLKNPDSALMRDSYGEYLYLDFQHALKKMEELPDNFPSRQVLVVHEEDLSEHAVPDFSFISVKNCEDFYELQEQIRELFDEFTVWYQDLCELCITGGNLHQILHLTERLTPNHIYISDMSFKVVSYTKKEIMPAISATWNYQTEYGYLPLHIMQGLIQSGELEKMNHCRKAVLFHSTNFAIPFTCRNIYFSNKAQFHLFVVNCMRRPCLRDRFIADLLGEFLTRHYYLLPSNQGGLTEKSHEPFLTDILNGTLTDRKLIERQISILNWSLPEMYCMALIHLMDRNTSFTQMIRYYLDKNSQYIYFGYEDYLVVLIANPQKEREKLKSLLTDLAQSYALDICLGDSYEGFLKIRSQFSILKRTQNIAHRYTGAAGFIEASEYSIYYLVDYISQSEELRPFCCHEAEYLLEFDEQNDTSYFETLKVYLLHDSNTLKAAKELHIHRNTLNYRLNKINDLIGLDQFSATRKVHLFLSIMILDHELNFYQKLK